MTINLNVATDYFQTFTYQDSDGELIGVSDASFRVTSNDVTAYSLDYTATVPSEVAIAAMNEDERGYLCPVSGATLELHISDLGVIAEGSYFYDLKVQESDTLNWVTLVSGPFLVTSAGDVSLTDVAAWRGVSVPTGTDALAMQAVLDAVYSHISSVVSPNDIKEPAVRQAIMMQTARLWKRRESPGGIESYDEFGAIRVTRFDPDVEALLSPHKVWVFA